MTQETILAPETVSSLISESELLNAQKNWCDALIAIGSAYLNCGHAAARALAESVVDQLYGYQLGPVLFKPTLSSNPQTFRTSRAGALSYFVAGDPDYPNDKGFALRGWTRCRVENAALHLAGNFASVMGKVHFTEQDGSLKTVDKTLGFLKDSRGDLRIILHHSSLEYVVPSQ